MKIEFTGLAGCAPCTFAQQRLDAKGIEYTYVPDNTERHNEMVAECRRMELGFDYGFPMWFVDGKYYGCGTDHLNSIALRYEQSRKQITE